jgi:chromosome segregation ATPase
MNEHDKTQALKDFKRWHAADLKRIAELEAENKLLDEQRKNNKQKREQAEADRDMATSAMDNLARKLTEAEAELAALWAAHSKHHPSCEDCGEAARQDGES